MQLIVSALHSGWCGVGDVLSMFLPAHLVAPSLHLLYEFLPAASSPHGRLHCGDELKLPALSPHSGPVFPGSQTTGPVILPVWFESGQAVFHTNLVADLPHLLQRSGSEMEFLPGIRMDGVDHQMGVKVLPVHMSCYQDLTAGEESLRQFQTDLMGLGGSKLFFRGKGLGVLVEEGASVFSVEAFSGHEALHGHICHAVDPRQVAVALLVYGFLWLGYILDHLPHAPSRLLAFIDEATGRRDESPDLSPSVC